MPINPDTKQVSIYNFAGNTDVVVDLDGYYSRLPGREPVLPAGDADSDR